MDMKNKPLARLIIETATARMPESVNLTQTDCMEISAMVEIEVRAAVLELKPEDLRAGFELGSEIKRGILARINLDTYKDKPLRKKAAQRFVGSLLQDWQWFIRRSESFKLLEESVLQLKSNVQ